MRKCDNNYHTEVCTSILPRGKDIFISKNDCDKQVNIKVDKVSTVIIKGYVTDLYDRPVSNALVSLIKCLDNGRKITICHTYTDCDGYYQFDIKKNRDDNCEGKYRVYVSKCMDDKRDKKRRCDCSRGDEKYFCDGDYCCKKKESDRYHGDVVEKDFECGYEYDNDDDDHDDYEQEQFNYTYCCECAPKKKCKTSCNINYRYD